MKALCWYGANDVRVERVPDPQLLDPRDAIVAVTGTAICGSDLHLYHGFIPGMRAGDILGHEFCGAAFAKGVTIRMGQTHVQRYLPTLLGHVQSGTIDSQFLVTHRLPLEDGPRTYELFAKKQDGCVKVVLQP